METVISAIRAIRNIRLEMNVPVSKKANIIFVAKDRAADVLKNSEALFAKMASASSIAVQASKDGIPEDAAASVVDGAEIYIPLDELIDFDKEIDRLTKDMWVFFLYLPVPIASIAFGIYLKKKGYAYRKNVIVGIVMAALLCIYGSFTFIFPDFYSHSDEPIVDTEQMLNIDIPEHSRINTQDFTSAAQSFPRGYIYWASDIYFEEAAVEQFEEGISNDAKWLSDIPNDIIGITSYFCDIGTSDYYIIYNKDTGEFNSLPSEDGTYTFINVLYDTEGNSMKIVEYQMEYTK